MNVIVCLDEQNGMLFNKRRQSRDQHLIDDINKMVDTNLYINTFSKNLFLPTKCIVDEAFLEHAQKDDYCFVENQRLMDYVPKIDRLIVYKWNRKYPTDFKLDISLPVNFMKTSTSEFTGKSHELITKEIWEKMDV